jgi:hypothetical protein
MANKKSSPDKPKKRYIFEFSLTSLLFSGIGCIFILVWVFALGIMVGRGFLPRSMEGFWFFKGKEVSEEKGKKAKQVPLIKEEDLTFYNQLTDKESTARSEPPHQAPPRDQVTPQPRRKIDQRQTENKDKYRVQVAALKDKGKTEEMVERLIKSGYPAYYYKTLIKGVVYYRVRCGPFSTADQAKGLAARLVEREGFKPFIVYPNSD